MRAIPEALYKSTFTFTFTFDEHRPSIVISSLLLASDVVMLVPNACPSGVCESTKSEKENIWGRSGGSSLAKHRFCSDKKNQNR